MLHLYESFYCTIQLLNRKVQSKGNLIPRGLARFFSWMIWDSANSVVLFDFWDYEPFWVPPSFLSKCFDRSWTLFCHISQFKNVQLTIPKIFIFCVSNISKLIIEITLRVENLFVEENTQARKTCTISRRQRSHFGGLY